MAIPAIIHIIGEDAIMADLDEIPDPTHTYLLVRNLRKKDGKELTYIADGATAFLYSWNRITFNELMGEVPGTVAVAASSVPQGTSVLGFFRDDDR